MGKTAYGRMMDTKRREEKDKNHKPKTAKWAQEHGMCGAKKRNGEFCTQRAGRGTDHLGFGACNFHGGNMTNHRKAALKNEAVLMGAPKEINPLDALIWCIKLTAGEVEFCTQQLEILKEEDWLESTLVGKQIHVWGRERQKAVDRLAKFSKDALALGIADRAVRLAEQYGHSIARYTKGLLDDLNLTPEQTKVAPLLVRKHLALLEGGAPVTDEDRRELPAIPKRVA